MNETEIKDKEIQRLQEYINNKNNPIEKRKNAYKNLISLREELEITNNSI